MLPLPARLLVCLLLALPGSVEAGTFVVDTTADDPALTACDDAVSNDCSLRGAILTANGRPLPEASTINVPAGTYVVTASSSCDYRRRDSPHTFTSSQVTLCVAKNVTLQGGGAATTIIDGNQTHRVFFISADATLQLSNVTVAHGLGDRGFDLNPHGGGIANEGTLTLTDSVVRNSSVPAGAVNGGGINNTGVLTLVRSAVSDNVSPGGQLGGGIFNQLAAALSLSESTISNNVIAGGGGGIANNGGVVTVTNSTVSGNTTDASGGGIASSNYNAVTAVLTMVNSTISGNTSGSSGAGIASTGGVADLNNVTITNNTGATTRGSGGGVSQYTGVLTLRNTVIAGNRDLQFGTSPDCSGTLVSRGYNLIQNTTGCIITGDLTGNIVGEAAQLGPLGDYGGPTETHALLAGSPALDAGNPAVPGSGGFACAAIDQRGFNRLHGGESDSPAICDIGAFDQSAGGFSLLSIRPDTGGNTGSVLALAYGSGFEPGATVKLVRTGQADIVGTPVQGDVGGSAIAATFDLVGRAIGPWDVVVTNPDETSKALAAGFAIEEGRAPELWVDVLGPRGVRAGRPARLTLLYGNRGNVDAVAVPLSFSFPVGYEPGRFFAITPPPPQSGQVRDDWSQVPLSVATGAPSDFINAPMLLQVVPAGFTGILQIELTSLPGAEDSQFYAALGDPLFNPDLDPEIVSDAIAGAQAYLLNEGVTVASELAPDLEEYVTNQFQLVKESGYAAFVANLGSQPQIYSVSQLHFDLVFFALTRLSELRQASAVPRATFDWVSMIYRSLVSLSPRLGPAEAEAQQQNCPPAKKGQPLGGGCFGGGGPNEPYFPPEVPVSPECKGQPGELAIDVLLRRYRDPKCRPSEADCEELGSHKVVEGGGGQLTCVPKKPPKDCPSDPLKIIPGNQCKTFPLRPRSSFDPNDKVGTLGATAAQFLLNATPLSYTVFFENLETATAAAQEVVITDQLDVQTMDLDTFSLGPISFGGDTTLVPAPGVQQYTGGVDLRPDQNLIVTIIASLDKTSGVLTWRFTSIDPDTGQFTEDPEAGFLPPNVTSPEGEGSVVFTVQPKPGLATGTEIRNEARIVFDTNAPIDTPEWLNTVDASVPTSQVQPLPATQATTSFPILWAGTDDGAGILDYSIFVSVDGRPVTAFLTDTTDTSATFSGELGKTYAFYSVARDLAGNVEDAPAVADAVTALTDGTPPACVGDCDDDGMVAVNELVLGVNIALDQQSVSACSAFASSQGMVDVAQLVKGVNNFLGGCGG